MELRQLGYFIAVAEEQSFTRAAERLHVAQPGISQQIRTLERDLGEQLFDRANHAVRLTGAGQAFLPHARAALMAADEGRSVLAELRGLVRAHLVLGAIQGLADLDLAGLLSHYHERYPGVEVTLREEHTDPLIEALGRGELDGAIIGLGSPHPPEGIDVEVVTVEPLVFVTSADHLLATRAAATIEDLRGEALVTLTRGSGLRHHVEAACAQAGFRPHIAFETSDVRLLTDLVAHGLGVTVVPRSVAAAAGAAAATGPPGALHVLDIDPPLPSRYIALAWRRAGPHSPAARAFLALAREHFTTIAAPPGAVFEDQKEAQGSN